MSAPFTFTSPNPLLAQPDAGGEELVFVSDNTADTGNLSITGLVTASSTTDTAALTGKREKLTADPFQSLTIAKLSAAQTGTIRIYGLGTAAAGDLRVESAPANNDTLRIGLAGFVQTYTFKTALTGGGTTANEILIHATPATQATYIYEAINKGANGGTHYGSATVANAFVAASAPVGAVIALTDYIQVARQLAWTTDQSVGTTISIRPMIGGVTGALLAELSPGTTMAYDTFSLSSEDGTTITLPAKFTGTSDAIAVNGRPYMIRHHDDGNGNDSVNGIIEESTDGTNWHSSDHTLSDHLDSGVTEFVTGDQLADYIHLVISANTNTADLAVDARAIFG